MTSSSDSFNSSDSSNSGPLPVALVPGALALLASYASLVDPVADLRAACLRAVGALGPRVRVVASGDAGLRVGAGLVAAAGASRAESDAEADATGVLVVGNGSAKRTEKAPGHFDERAEGFDEAIRVGLLAGGPVEVDATLAEELWADVGALEVVRGLATPEVLYDDQPFGVAYWVMLWR